MAKKQTFTDKVGKDNKKFKFVKYIQTLFSEESGGVKFLSRMLRLEENENIDQALKREEESSNISSFADDFVEQNQETPAEDNQEEAPVEETPTEEPAEEVSEEESAPEEDSAEEAEESSKE